MGVMRRFLDIRVSYRETLRPQVDRTLNGELENRPKTGKRMNEIARLGKQPKLSEVNATSLAICSQCTAQRCTKP